MISVSSVGRPIREGFEEKGGHFKVAAYMGGQIESDPQAFLVHDLHSPGYVAPRKLTAQLAEHGRSSRALLGPADVLLEDAPQSVPASVAVGGLRGRAWCPTPLALQRLRSCGVEPEPHPSPAVLRRVNHRLFAHELGGGLPDQAYVAERAELLALLGDCKRRWLLKRPLTFAGRGQLRVIGPLTEKQRSWVDVSLARDGLIVEPLVTPTFEVSLHGFVWPNGRREPPLAEAARRARSPDHLRRCLALTR